MEYFAVQVKTRGEDKFLKLAHYMMETYHLYEKLQGKMLWPRRELRIRRRGKWKNSIKPIFPGYIFLQTESIHPDIYWTFKRIDGFFRFLKSNTQIEPLEGPDRQLLTHFLSYGEIVERSKVSFDKNQRIRVAQGPMKGLEGNIVKIDKRKGRAKVRLKMYEDFFLVDFGFDLLEPNNR